MVDHACMGDEEKGGDIAFVKDVGPISRKEGGECRRRGGGRDDAGGRRRGKGLLIL